MKDHVSSMSPAGDLNFDGIDDFIIVGSDMINIVYGSSDGFPVEFDREVIDGTNGFLIDDLDGTGRGIDGGKDFNGDGKADFIFTDRTYDDRNVYLVFGGDHFAIPFHENYPKIEDITTESFLINVKAQEKGKVHYAVFESSTYYSVNYEAINSGSDAIMHGEFPVNSENTEITKLIDGLKSSTKYDVHLYFEDEADNIGEIYSFEEIKTLFDPETAFVTTWDTEKEGESNSNQIRFVASASSYDIQWEKLADPSINGVLEDLTGTTTITFPEVGKYKVAISNSIHRFYFTSSYPNDSKKLLTVEQWGTTQWGSMERMFLRCSNMTMPATDIPDLSNVTSMEFMFGGATQFNTDINDWDVSNVTNFRYLFSNASSFNQDLDNWEVSNVTDMVYTFNSATSFNSDITNWDVRNVTNMNGMFQGASVFNQDISDWDVSKVTNMARMFNESQFNQDIGDWDVSKVISMSRMFYKASAFNQDISKWDVSQNTEMDYMFAEASNFNQDIGGWDVSKVETMRSTFYKASDFDQNLGAWDISNVESFISFFYQNGLSPCNYSATLEGWSHLTLQNDLIFWGGWSLYNADAEVYRQKIIDDFNWTIFDDGKLTNEAIITVNQEVSCPGASDAILDGSSSLHDVDFKWYNEEGDLIGEDAILENIGAGTYTLKVETTADCFFTKEITLNDGADTEEPEITCPEDQELIPGENIPDYTSPLTLSDNCDSDVSVSQSPEAGTEFTEETTVILTAEDASGNTKICTFLIEVTPDTEAPEITCPENQTLACDATEIPDYTDLVSVSDNRDSDPVVTQSPSVGGTFTDGITITITAKDAAGNESTCEFLVNLEEDTESPVVECLDDQELIPGENIPDYTSHATLSDNCDSDVSVSQSPEAGTEFTEATTVTLTAEDESGNTKSCTFLIEVTPDTEAPEITCPENQTLACDATEIPDYTDLVSVTDDRDSSPVVTQSPTAGSEFTEGMTITISAEDVYGNVGSCDFEVHREADSTSPSIICIEDQTITIGESLPDYTEIVMVSDNCDADPEVHQSIPAGTEVTEDLTITITAEDASGNIENCKFQIIATTEPDTTPPNISCINDQNVSCDQNSIPDFTNMISVEDNRDPDPLITQSPAAGTSFTDGMTIIITAEDKSGNTSNCEFFVFSEDTQAPEVTCLETQTLEEGQSLPDYTAEVSVSDNCDDNLKINQSPEAGFEVVEDMELSITVEDKSGNSTTCSFQIEVDSGPDTIAPEITCPDSQTLSCNETEIPDFREYVSVTDNRDSNPKITQSPSAGSPFAEGMLITITAEDAAGNTSSCTFDVLEDRSDLSIACLDDQEINMTENCEAVIPDFTELIEVEEACSEIERITQSPSAGTVVFEDSEVSIEVIDVLGNKVSCNFNLKVNGESSPTLEISEDVKINAGESVELNANASSEGSYQWFPSFGLDNPTIANPTASPDKSTNYSVVFTNKFGCSVEAEMTVKVEEGIRVSKGFSPDNDGINDIWKIHGIKEYQKNEVLIYNRWGNIVFAIKGYDNQYNVFDGTANRNNKLGGGELPEGTYFYKIHLQERDSQLEGFIVLKR
ncbi:BspA family leucine-rich repeat surface protein [Marivirga tractuosa]|uniref:BspA family leucine-rich repeat surface protein n=1 Tax=Marivirga tractuosa TaxID=1006 RepID=UPI0035D0B155